MKSGSMAAFQEARNIEDVQDERDDPPVPKELGKTKKVGVELAMLVRMTKHVVVEVPEDFEVDSDKASDFLSEVYEVDDGDGFEMDDSWGCEEATHYLHELPKDQDLKPDYKLVDGVVEKA
jgi:hypothetical protein